MTIDEAIKHAEEVADKNERLCETVHPAMQLSDYGKCAEEHRQLAEWLKDYKRLLEQEPRWIPVSERLPEESGEYLITIKDRTYLEISWFYPSDKKWSYRNADIIAWQSLPKPYKAESEDKE